MKSGLATCHELVNREKKMALNLSNLTTSRFFAQIKTIHLDGRDGGLVPALPSTTLLKAAANPDGESIAAKCINTARDKNLVTSRATSGIIVFMSYLVVKEVFALYYLLKRRKNDIAHRHFPDF